MWDCENARWREGHENENSLILSKAGIFSVVKVPKFENNFQCDDCLFLCSLYDGNDFLAYDVMVLKFWGNNGERKQ